MPESKQEEHYILRVLAAVVAGVAVIFFFVLPIVNIVIGATYLDDCPAEKYIPIYLVVMGAVTMASGLLVGGVRASRRKSRNKEIEQTVLEHLKPSVLEVLLALFIVAWFIAGNVWIYKEYNKTNEDLPEAENYCHPTLYRFAFWSTTTYYIILGVALLLAGLIALLAHLLIKIVCEE